MPTPMHVFHDIASRHGADPTDEAAIEKWYVDVLLTFPAAEAQAIFEELLSREGEPEPEGYVPPVRTYPTEDVPVPLLDESLRVNPRPPKRE